MELPASLSTTAVSAFTSDRAQSQHSGKLFNYSEMNIQLFILIQLITLLNGFTNSLHLNTYSRLQVCLKHPLKLLQLDLLK